MSIETPASQTLSINMSILRSLEYLGLLRNISLYTFALSDRALIWMPPNSAVYLVEHRDFDAEIAGWVTSSQWLARAAGAALGGWICDRMCKKLGLRWGGRWPIIGGMVLSGVLLIWGAFTANQAVAVTMLALCFFFNQLCEGPYWSTSIAIGGQFAGTAGGLLNTGANLMGALGAVLVPMFASSFDWTIAIASGEPPRLYRRLHTLRRWSYEYIKKIFSGSPGTRSAHGAGAAKGTQFTVGHNPVNRIQTWLHE
jgi:MFS family permease